MQPNLYNTITYFLRKNDYPTTEALRLQCLSHPNYPGLTSIIDTLAYLGINSTAAEVPKAALQQLTEPFLAHLKQGYNEEFAFAALQTGGNVLVYSGKDKPTLVSENDFLNLWTGLIVAIDKNVGDIQSGWIDLKNMLPYAGAVIGVLFLVFFKSNSFLFFLYSILSLIGVGITVLIARHQMGLLTGVENRFCTLHRNTSCDAVLQSKAATIGKHSLGDIGLVYFVGQAFAIVVLSGGNHTGTVLAAIGLLAMPFTLFSLYYQALVIKKWCPLCLVVVAVLWLQAFVSIPLFIAAPFCTNVFVLARPLTMVTILMGFSAIIWGLLKPSISKLANVKNLEIEILRFRRNHYLLMPYLKQAPVLDTHYISNGSLLLGEANAGTTILFITNPLCQACQKAHSVLHNILQKYPDDINIQMVFYVPVQHPQDPRTMLAAWLCYEYEHNRDKFSDTVHNWYSNPSIEHFKKLNLPDRIVAGQLPRLGRHRGFCETNGLARTPLLLLDGRIYPSWYNTEDIAFVVEEWINSRPEAATNTLLVHEQINNYY